LVAGILFIVATPIGNLEDITYRAVRILREVVDAIACEDTRETRKLLDHFAITKPLISYHDHNEAERAGDLAARLKNGERIALVSDAGTPLISDPGYRIVRRAIAEGIAVVTVPGPSSVTAALAGSGLPTDAFYFAGFISAKRSQKLKMLNSIMDLEATVVLFEAPHRILDTLEDIEAVLGSRQIVLARELTKIHEEFLRGTPSELHQELARRPSVRGEFTVLIARAEPGVPARDVPVGEAVRGRMAEGSSRMDAIKSVAHERGLAKREVYRMLEEEKNS
jgi:16S rRNA (cytidine1402-2'-O)-methyltransferase